jgi:hypothetical protein
MPHFRKIVWLLDQTHPEPQNFSSLNLDKNTSKTTIFAKTMVLLLLRANVSLYHKNTQFTVVQISFMKNADNLTFSKYIAYYLHHPRASGHI